MASVKKGKYWYGESIDDVKEQVRTFSKGNGYPASKFSESICECGGKEFHLESDEEEGVARRSCVICSKAMFMGGDGAIFACRASLEEHLCVCDSSVFQLLSGVSLYPQSNDVRWYYIGCRCSGCGLVGVFAEWKCDSGDADEFLSSV